MSATPTKKSKSQQPVVSDIWGVSPPSVYPENVSLPPKALSRELHIVGVEVEVEHVAPQRVKIGDYLNHFSKGYGNWSYKEDNSLRNQGLEWITAPTRSDYIQGHFIQLIEAFRASGAKYDFNARTSIHVHLDVTKWTIPQLQALVLTYILFERSIFKFVNPLRKDSIFCIPIQQTLLPAGFLLGGNSTIINNWLKYSGFNMLPITKQGTVEFRHLEGTDDVNKFTKWIRIILALADFAHSLPDRGISNLMLVDTILKLNSNSAYTLFAREVFGNAGWEDLWLDPTTPADMVKGIKYIKTVETTSTGYGRDWANSIIHRDMAWKNKSGTLSAFMEAAAPIPNLHAQVVQDNPPMGPAGPQATWATTTAAAAAALNVAGTTPDFMITDEN